MEITNKNKEEIEKVEKGCKKEVIDKIHCGDRTGIYSQLWLCPICKRAKQERIKTSILWCEGVLEIVKKYEHLQLQPLIQELKEFETHLEWLKEQEKDED